MLESGDGVGAGSALIDRGGDQARELSHDRGGRVTHRLLRDHPDKVTRAATLDIVPTLYRFETIDQKAATGSWHWFF